MSSSLEPAWAGAMGWVAPLRRTSLARSRGIRGISASSEEVAGELAVVVARPVALLADLDDGLGGQLHVGALDVLCGGLGRRGAALGGRAGGLAGLLGMRGATL